MAVCGRRAHRHGHVFMRLRTPLSSCLLATAAVLAAAAPVFGAGAPASAFAAAAPARASAVAAVPVFGAPARASAVATAPVLAAAVTGSAVATAPVYAAAVPAFAATVPTLTALVPASAHAQPPAPAQAKAHAQPPRPAQAHPQAPATSPALLHATSPARAYVASPGLGRVATPAPLPSCTAPDDHTFPLTTRIHGGPGAYEAGGGFASWFVDLTNTTDRTCAGIHPVVVLVDEQRALRAAQPVLEFYDGATAHSVGFTRTEEDELVGALADDRGGFRGFRVGPGRTLRVKVRLAVTSDAGPNEVTAHAAVVQRRAGDGEWVGQSNDYRFRITPARTGSHPAEKSERPGGASPGPSTSLPQLPFADELAGTGLATLATALTAGVLVAAGAGAVVLARRRR